MRQWIIPIPEINFETRSEDDECLILASNELWDVMLNQEVGEGWHCVDYEDFILMVYYHCLAKWLGNISEMAWSMLQIGEMELW